MAVQHYSPMST